MYWVGISITYSSLGRANQHFLLRCVACHCFLRLSLCTTIAIQSQNLTNRLEWIIIWNLWCFIFFDLYRICKKKSGPKLTRAILPYKGPFLTLFYQKIKIARIMNDTIFCTNSGLLNLIMALFLWFEVKFTP